MKKTHKVVMLPTEKASRIHLANNKLIYGKELFTDGLTGRNQHLYITSNDEIKEGDWCLFFWDGGQLGSDKPQQYQPSKGHVLNDGLKKIVATTDTSLKVTDLISDKYAVYVPQLPESFIQAYIKAYNEDKPITEVDLEMDCDHNQMPNKVIDIIKTRPDNTVIVHQSKMYSRDEVEYLIKCATDEILHVLGYDTGKKMKETGVMSHINKWIQDNL